MFDLFFEGNALFLLLVLIALIQLIIWLFPSSKRRSRKSERDQDAREVITKLTPEALGLVEEKIRSNHKIEAIKIIRAETNAGLLQAKLCVEKLSVNMVGVE